MNMISLQRIGELHVSPKDLVNLVCKAETLIQMTEGELKKMKEEIDLELNFRENENG